jgi:hypothetical protein
MLLSILETFKIRFEELNRLFPKQKEEDAMDEDTTLDPRAVANRRPIITQAHSGDHLIDPIKGSSHDAATDN